MRSRKLLTGLLARPGLARRDGRRGLGRARTEQAGYQRGRTASASTCSSRARAIDDCQKAPSPIKPATNELIWGSISFVVLFALLYKLAWPGLKKSIDGRTEHIRSEVDEADRLKAEAGQILNEYQEQLADAKNESARIIEEARQTADALKRDQEQRLQAELTEMRQRAVADIEAAKAQAVADLRSEVAALAIGAAEQVVEHSLDRETNIALVEAYINQVGASN